MLFLWVKCSAIALPPLWQIREGKRLACPSDTAFVFGLRLAEPRGSLISDGIGFWMKRKWKIQFARNCSRVHILIECEMRHWQLLRSGTHIAWGRRVVSAVFQCESHAVINLGLLGVFVDERIAVWGPRVVRGLLLRRFFIFGLARAFVTDVSLLLRWELFDPFNALPLAVFSVFSAFCLRYCRQHLWRFTVCF